MKSNKLEKIPLLVAILALGTLASGVLSAQAQSSPPAQPLASVALSPGDYRGIFQFDVREIYAHSSTNPSLTLNIADNRDLDVSGTMSIHVTGPTSGYLIVAPTSYDIYEIRDISAKGSGVDCRMMGYINGDAEIVFLSPLVNSYDTKTESFISFLSISGWSTQDFRNNVISGHPACTEQVNEEGLTYEIQNFFDGISKISSLRFQVGYSGKNMLAGVVSLEGYEKSVQLPGGWWQRTTSGSWTVFKEPAKPKGWKK